MSITFIYIKTPIYCVLSSYMWPNIPLNTLFFLDFIFGFKKTFADMTLVDEYID